MTFVSAISYYLPEKSISNKQVIEEYEPFRKRKGLPSISDQMIVEQTGIKSRYQAEYHETTLDLGRKAAEKLFEDYNLDRSEIDYLIFVSDALEHKGPTTACILQHQLELGEHCASIDILHGCTGWIYGLSVAKAMIASNQATNVLLITGDVPTKVIHPEDYELRAIFSDAAAATLISSELKNTAFGNYEIGDFVFGTDGSGYKNLWVERSATKEPADIEWLDQYKSLPTGLGGGRLRMKSSAIFLFAHRKVPELIKSTLKKNQAELDQIDIIVPHQANGTMLDFLRKRMRIESHKFVNRIENTGNTVSASIPIALKQHINENGTGANNILVAGFGIGYSWGGTLLRKVK